MGKRLGKYTLRLPTPVSIIASACIGGKKESEGQLADGFDFLIDDPYFGMKSWEKAESFMQQDAVSRALMKANLAPGDIDFIFAGDLLNQCIASAFGLRSFNIHYFGL